VLGETWLPSAIIVIAQPSFILLRRCTAAYNQRVLSCKRACQTGEKYLLVRHEITVDVQKTSPTGRDPLIDEKRDLRTRVYVDSCWLLD
jgi:hypothetical protein